MPRTLEGMCANTDCTNDLPTGPGTSAYLLSEEKGFTPRPAYCCEACAKQTWETFYNVGTHKVNGEYPWATAEVVKGGRHDTVGKSE